MPESNSRRIAKNTTFLYMRMLVVMIINIFSVRFVLKGLGVVDYGVFNVVAGLVTMFSSLTSIISSATLRFHSYAIGEGKEEKVSDVFTASLNIFAILSIAILIIGEVIGLWFINTQADIPADRMTAANWVFHFTMITFVFGLLTAPFTSLIFAYERMSFFSVISVLECGLKILLAYSLIYLSGDHLMLYGIGLLLIQIGVLGTYFFASKKGGGRYYYKKKVEKALYKKMLSFSGWTLFSTSAGIGISQLVTMITNVFFGPVVNAARAIAFQINTAMNSFTGNIIMAIKPPMIKLYADGDYEKVNRYFNFSNKAVFFSLLVILLPIFFEMEAVLRLWLDVEDVQTTLFCRLILIYALVLALNNPISVIIQATGKIREYSTYVEIPTLLCFPATWLLYFWGYPAESAFYVMIVAIVLSHIIRLVCLKHLFPVFSYKKYVCSFLFPATFITIIISSSLFVVKNMMIAGYFRLTIMFLVGSLVLIVAGYLLGLNNDERNVLLSLLKKKRVNL